MSERFSLRSFASLMLCLLLFARPLAASAQSGDMGYPWEIKGTASGTGTTSTSPSGQNLTYFIIGQQVSETLLDLSTVNAPFQPSRTLIKTIRLHLLTQSRTDLGPIDNSALLTVNGQLGVRFTWKFQQQGPPSRLTVYIRPRVELRSTAKASRSGQSFTAGGSADVSPLHGSTSIASYNTQGLHIDAPAPQIGRFYRLAADVTNGTAEFKLPISAVLNYSANFLGEINTDAMGNVDGAGVTADLILDCALNGYDISRYPSDGGEAPNPINGNTAAQSKDPTWTRWLPLSFSPRIDSQPFRTAAGNLPPPWGNINCFYAITLRDETTGNYDLNHTPVDFIPIGPGDYDPNNPPPSQFVPYEPFPPRYSITDANGNRLLFDSGFHGYGDVKSTLSFEPVDGTSGYVLRDAGPPGAMNERGYYTYSFAPISVPGAPTGVWRLRRITDARGNIQQLNWNSAGTLLTVVDSSSGRSLRFYADPATNYVNKVEAADVLRTVTKVDVSTDGHLTGVRVYEPSDLQNALTSETFAYAGANGDAISSVSQGVAQVSYTYALDTLPLDPFRPSVPRVQFATYGSSGDNSPSSSDGGVAGSYFYTYGFPSSNSWSPQSRTNTITDPYGNITKILLGLQDGNSGPINLITTTGPDYDPAYPKSNVVSVFYGPNMVKPSVIAVTLPQIAPPYTSQWGVGLDAFQNVVAATDPLVLSSEFTYSTDGKNLLTAKFPTQDAPWNFYYGENGALASELSRVVDPVGTWRVQMAYNPHGQPTQITVPLGGSASGATEVTQFTYDETSGRGDLTDITDPLGNVIHIGSYTEHGDPRSVTLTPETGKTLTATMEINAAQQTTAATFPNDVRQEFVYTNGVPTQTKTFSPAVNNIRTLLSSSQAFYDSRGRLYRVDETAGNLTKTLAQYQYDKNSHLTRVTDGRGNTSSFTYGANGELRSASAPLGQSTTLTYNVGGLVQSVTDARGVLAYYGYDVAYRPTSLTVPAYAPAGTAAESYTYEYDLKGRALRVTSATGKAEYFYTLDNLHRLQSVVTTLNALPAGQQTYTVAFTYKPDGSVSSLTLTRGNKTLVYQYHYDKNGRLDQLLDPDGYQTQWTYDGIGRPLSQVTSLSQALALTTLYGYGNSGQAGDTSLAPAFLRTLTQKVGSTTLWQHSFVYSALGELLSQTGTGTNKSYSGVYTYSRGRLASESVSYTAGGQTFTKAGTYRFDDADNLLPDGTGADWQYDQNNRLTSAPAKNGLPGATGLSYDQNGNRITANGITFTYDCLNRLVQAGSVSYTYDALGRRASRTQNGVTTFLLYAGDTLLAETDSQGNVTRFYVQGALGLISHRYFPVVIGGNGAQAQSQAGGLAITYRRFYFFDGTGNTHTTVDENGAIKSELRSAAFGGVVGSSGESLPYGYQAHGGYYVETVNGWQVFVSPAGQSYTPSVGQWNAPNGSPAGAGGGFSPSYTPGDGDPVNNDGLNDEAGGYGDFLRGAGSKGLSDLQAQPAWQPGSEDRQRLSGMLQSVPVIGQGYTGYISAGGYDPIAGVKMSPGERAFTLGMMALSAGAKLSGPAPKSPYFPPNSVGKYSSVGGHHPHAQAALRNVVDAAGNKKYFPDKAFTISQAEILRRGWDHASMSARQALCYDEMLAGLRSNTLNEHTRIAVDALMAGGADQQEARYLVAQSLKSLRAMGIKNADVFRIPTFPRFVPRR